MSDLSQNENFAIGYSSECAGEYLDSIGKTDLKELTKEEWMTFITVVSINFYQKKNELDREGGF